MEAAEATSNSSNGSFTVKGTDRKMAFGEVALAAYVAHKFPTSEIEPGSRREPSTIPPTSPSRPAATSASSRSIPRPARHHRAMDGGRRFRDVINPMIVEGQVHGGIAQASAGADRGGDL
jgi:carbon-monoxide dehydrogenase large subunit